MRKQRLAAGSEKGAKLELKRYVVDPDMADVESVTMGEYGPAVDYGVIH